jgi:hypothetical protein
MTMWYNGNGWGWCSEIVGNPAMVLLWGAVVTAIILAIGVASRQRSDPPALTGTGSARPGGAEAAHHVRGGSEDEFFRRLM